MYVGGRDKNDLTMPFGLHRSMQSVGTHCDK